jgi:hypothetical protein
MGMAEFLVGGILLEPWPDVPCSAGPGSNTRPLHSVGKEKVVVIDHQAESQYLPMPKNLPNIQNEKQYEALIEKDYSKEKAARIANTENAGRKGGHAKPYEERTKAELYEQAQAIGIEGRSRMNKAELIEALRNH